MGFPISPVFVSRRPRSDIRGSLSLFTHIHFTASIFCHICVINRIFSHLFQILVTLSSHFSCILLAIEGDELSIIFFFFIRAGTKVPASFHLWGIFFHPFIIEFRNETFGSSFPLLDKSILNSHIYRSIQNFFIFPLCYFSVQLFKLFKFSYWCILVHDADINIFSISFMKVVQNFP